MGKVISSIVNGVETIKQNYKYFKSGRREANREYAKLQRIKNTPENFRTKADTDYANKMNKTKLRTK